MFAVSEKKGCSVRLPDTQHPSATISLGSPSRQAASELEGGKLCLQHRRDEGIVINNPESPRQHAGSPRSTPSSLAALLRRLPRHLVVCIAHDSHEKPDKAQPGNQHAKAGIRSACRRPAAFQLAGSKYHVHQKLHKNQSLCFSSVCLHTPVKNCKPKSISNRHGSRLGAFRKASGPLGGLTGTGCSLLAEMWSSENRREQPAQRQQGATTVAFFETYFQLKTLDVNHCIGYKDQQPPG